MYLSSCFVWLRGATLTASKPFIILYVNKRKNSEAILCLLPASSSTSLPYLPFLVGSTRMNSSVITLPVQRHSSVLSASISAYHSCQPRDTSDGFLSLLNTEIRASLTPFPKLSEQFTRQFPSPAQWQYLPKRIKKISLFYACHTMKLSNVLCQHCCKKKVYTIRATAVTTRVSNQGIMKMFIHKLCYRTVIFIGNWFIAMNSVPSDEEFCGKDISVVIIFAAQYH